MGGGGGGGVKRLGGEMSRGGETTKGETTRGKRLGGETTRGRNGLGAKRPRFIDVGNVVSTKSED